MGNFKTALLSFHGMAGGKPGSIIFAKLLPSGTVWLLSMCQCLFSLRTPAFI